VSGGVSDRERFTASRLIVDFERGLGLGPRSHLSAYARYRHSVSEEMKISRSLVRMSSTSSSLAKS
jgi:hypothetical protein